ncbi:hypothetical protein GCM10009678_85670 [Actinomadura kijaniata]
MHPELERGLALASEIRAAETAVPLVVHEHERLGRGIPLEFLTVRPAPQYRPWGSPTPGARSAVERRPRKGQRPQTIRAGQGPFPLRWRVQGSNLRRLSRRIYSAPWITASLPH